MAEEIANLVVKVDTKEVRAGTVALDTLAKAGPKVVKATDGITQSVDGLAAALPRTKKAIKDVEGATNDGAAASEKLRVKTEKLAASQATLKANLEKMAQATGLSAKELDALLKSAAGAKKGVDDMNTTMGPGTTRAADMMRNALISIGIGASLSQMIALSDQYVKLTSQLKLATLSQREYAEAYGNVKRISNSGQGDLVATGVLFAKITNGTRELGLAQAQVAKITETVSLSLKVSGAGAGEAASAMLQLSQAFASGVLRGDEFNAVNEAAPRLMLALADGIGVSVGALRKMAEEGELTSKVMANALPKALTALREEAKSVQTISGAFQVLKNNMLEFVGTQSQASGAVSLLTSGIGLLSNNIGTLVNLLITVVAVKLAVWAAGVYSSMMLAATGLGAATIAARGFSTAMAFLGGPIGLVVTALGLGITAWQAWGKAGADAEKKVTAAVEESTVEMIARLDQQIAKLNERNRLAKIIPGIDGASDADIGGITRAGAAVRAAENGTGEYAGQSAGVRQIALIDLNLNLATAINKVTEAQRKTKEAAEGTRDTQIKDWFGKNGTNAQKLAADLEELRKKFGTGPPEMEKLARAKYDDKSAGNKAASAVKKEISAYGTLIASIKEKIAATDAEAAGLKPLNDAQKLQVAMTEQVAAGKLKLTPRMKAEYEAQIKLLGVNIDVIASNKRAAEGAKEMEKIVADKQKDVDRSIDQAMKEAEKNEELAATFGMTKGAIEALELARLQEQLAQRASAGLTIDEIANLEKLIAAKARSAGAAGKIDEMEAAKKSGEDMKKMWEDVDKTANDAFVSMFNGGKATFDRLKDTLKSGLLQLLYSMTVKKWIFNISASVTGGGVAGQAQAAGNSMISSVGGSLASSATTAIMGSTLSGAGAGAVASGATYGTGFATQQSLMLLAQETTGIASAAASTAAGAASSLGTLAAAAGPYVLAAMAVYALYTAFKSGETRSGGQYGYSFNGKTVSNARRGTTGSAGGIGAQFVEGPSGGDPYQKEAKAAINATVVSINDTLKAVGSSSALVGFNAGYESSKNERGGVFAGGKLSTGGSFGESGQGDNYAGTLYEKTSSQSPEAKEAMENFAVDLQQATIQALQVAVNVPKIVADMVRGVDAETLSADAAGELLAQINAVVGGVTAFKQAVASMPFENLRQLSFDAAAGLIAAAGGMEKLGANLSAYYDNFYSESERSAATLASVGKVLSAVNIALPTTRDGFRKLVESQNVTTETGKAAYVALLSVAGAFASVTAEAEGSAASLTDRIATARSALSDAYKTEADALGSVIDRFRSFGTSLRSFKDSLLLGSNSPLTPGQKYATAKGAFQNVAAGAAGGDVNSIEQLQSASQSFLEASRLFNASGDAYTADFDAVQQAVGSTVSITQLQVANAEKQLIALDASVVGLIEINKSVLSVKDALAVLQAAMTEQQAALTAQVAKGQLLGPAFDLTDKSDSYKSMFGGTGGTQLTGTPRELYGYSDSYMASQAANSGSFGGATAVVTEIQALRAEVVALRTDNSQQTAAQIETAHDTSDRNAATIVDAQAATSMTEVWRSFNRVLIR